MASLVSIATQVGFIHGLGMILLDLLFSPEEKDEIPDLFNWWNWYGFPISFICQVGLESLFNPSDSQVFPSYVRCECEEENKVPLLK